MALFSETKRILRLAKFDELTVYPQFEELYDKLNTNNLKAYVNLYSTRYLEILTLFCKDKKLIAEKEDTIDLVADMYIMGICETPNPITGYKYGNEVRRKKEKAREKILATKGIAQKQEEMDKALKHWSGQTAIYSDIVHDEATVNAMKDAGIKRVLWHTQEDGKVCTDCEKYDKRVFRISQIPDTHPNCRCWVSPVDD